MRSILTIVVMLVGLLHAQIGNANCWNDLYISLSRMQACHETGADVNSPSLAFRSMLHRVAEVLETGRQIQPEIFEFLVKEARADVNLKDADGKTVLHKVSRFDHVRLLIEAGADVNARDNHGWPVILGRKSLDSMKALIEAGLDVNAKNVGNTGKTLLGIFVESYEFPIVEMLINNGANVNSLSDGDVPICWVTRRDERRGDHAKIAHSLIQAGAVTEIECSNGDTPLVKATWNTQADLVRVLLATGARLTDLDEALMYACSFYHDHGRSEEDRLSYGAIIGMLMAAGARRDCPLQSS